MTDSPVGPGECGTCARIRSRDDQTAQPWDAIIRTGRWDVVHAYDTSLPGWLVLVPVRHVLSIDQLTADEAAELGSLIHLTSRFLKSETGCLKTYVMQFAEHPEHPHVHFHVVPRHQGLAPEAMGPGVFAYLSAEDGTRVAEEVMNGLAARLNTFWRAEMG